MKKKSLLLTAVATLGLTAAMMAQSVPSYVPTNGLVGWWPFNGNANDESGNGNNGTVNGAILTPDRFGSANSAYYFSSSGCATRIDVDNMNFSNQPNGFTFSYWIKRQGGGCIYPRLFEFGVGNPIDSWGSSWSNSGNLDYVNTVLFSNVWYHIVNTFDGDSLRTYLNGLHETTYELVKSLPLGNDVAFGRMNHSAWDAFNGDMDDLGVWDRVLSSCEITDLYNAQVGSLNTFSTQTQTSLDSYTWPVNGQSYTQSGTYTAVIPNAAGCDSTITLDLTLSFTGIDEQENSTILISPNPASDYLVVSASKELIGESYSIIDLNGKTLKEGTLTQKEQKIEIGNLSEGMYMFRINNETEQTFRIVKN